MTKANILIAEDKEEFRTIYGDRLRFGGYEVFNAADGNEALAVLRSQKIDLVMTDINMPNKDGYGLISEAKADPALKHIPILVMSVFDQSDHVKKALELGASGYLVKGVTTPNDVLKKINELIVEGKK